MAHAMNDKSTMAKRVRYRMQWISGAVDEETCNARADE
jgi:hypothetical protein